jgi:hypothetical protein
VTPRAVAAFAILCSQALLLAAFAVAGRPLGMAAAGLCAAAWLLVLARSAPGAAPCLGAALGLAILALLAGAPGWLPSLGAGAALASWDLTTFCTQRERAPDASGERALLASRLRGLAVGILPGLALAGVLGHVRLDLPFAVVAALAAAAVLLLDRASRRWG